MTRKMEMQYTQSSQVANPEKVSFLGALQLLIALFQRMA